MMALVGKGSYTGRDVGALNQCYGLSWVSCRHVGCGRFLDKAFVKEPRSMPCLAWDSCFLLVVLSTQKGLKNIKNKKIKKKKKRKRKRKRNHVRTNGNYL